MEVEIGDGLVTDATVSEEMTARAVGSGGLDVLATPTLIALFENACFELLEEKLSAENSSVGTFISIKHISPTPIGLKVIISITVSEINKNTITFDLKAKDSKGEISMGTHKRAVVDIDKFLEIVDEKTR